MYVYTYITAFKHEVKRVRKRLMYVVNYLQDEQTEEMQKAAPGRREFEMWNAEASCSHTKYDTDEGEAGVEIFRTTASSNGVSLPVQKGLQELTEYHKETSEPSTVGDGLLNKNPSVVKETSSEE